MSDEKENQHEESEVAKALAALRSELAEVRREIAKRDETIAELREHNEALVRTGNELSERTKDFAQRAAEERNELQQMIREWEKGSSGKPNQHVWAFQTPASGNDEMMLSWHRVLTDFGPKANQPLSQIRSKVNASNGANYGIGAIKVVYLGKNDGSHKPMPKGHYSKLDENVYPLVTA